MGDIEYGLEFLFGIAAVVIIVLVVAAVWGDEVRTRNEKRVMRECAAGLGLSFAEEADLTLLDFELLLARSEHDNIVDAIQGQVNGINIKIFNYVIRFDNKQAPVYIQTVAMLDSKHQRLPDFQLYPPGMFDRIRSAVGTRHIEFQSHVAFPKAYILKGSDEQAIRKVFTREILDYLYKNTGSHVEVNRNRMIYYRDDVCEEYESENMRVFLDKALALYRLFQR